MAERICAHEPCRCEPEAGFDFCGSACARQGRIRLADEVTDYCPCGHAECRPEHVSPDQPLPHAQPERS